MTAGKEAGRQRGKKSKGKVVARRQIWRVFSLFYKRYMENKPNLHILIRSVKILRQLEHISVAYIARKLVASTVDINAASLFVLLSPLVLIVRSRQNFEGFRFAEP